MNTPGGDMPEVKWVHEKFLRDDPEGPRTFTREAPVLTLDQITAWLKQCVDARTTQGLHVCIDDLLAQVQAWRTQGDTR